MSDSSRFTSSQVKHIDGGLITGRLEAHGPAKYQFRADQSPSYFVKITTNRGVRVLWGSDLARAFSQSVTSPKVGSIVGARRTGYDTFTFSERGTQRVMRRNRWIIESVQFFADRAQLARRVRDAQVDARRAVKDHPELVSTYLSLRGAQDIAERRIADPGDRERFLALVREAMAKSIKNGEPLPEIRLRERIKPLDKGTSTARAIKREDAAR